MWLGENYGDAVVARSDRLDAFSWTFSVVAVTLVGRVVLGRSEHVVLELVIERPESLGGSGLFYEFQFHGTAERFPKQSGGEVLLQVSREDGPVEGALHELAFLGAVGVLVFLRGIVSPFLETWRVVPADYVELGILFLFGEEIVEF